MCDLVCADQLLHPLFDSGSLGLLYLALQFETLVNHEYGFRLGLRASLEQLRNAFQKLVDGRQSR